MTFMTTMNDLITSSSNKTKQIWFYGREKRPWNRYFALLDHKKATQDEEKAIQDHNRSLMAMLGYKWPQMSMKT